MGDELTALVRTSYPALLRRAYLLTGDRAAAEDLVQDSLARFWFAQRRRQADFPDAYLQRTMVNLHISRWRRRRTVREDATDRLPDTAAPDCTGEHAARDEMWTLLAQVPPRQRAVLVLRFYEDLPEAEIAELLGVTVGTVRSQTAKGIAKLRRSLTAAAGEPANAERSDPEQSPGQPAGKERRHV